MSFLDDWLTTFRGKDRPSQPARTQTSEVKAEDRKIKIASGSTSHLTCPFCQVGDFHLMASLGCQNCGAIQHLACWAEAENKCSTCKKLNPNVKLCFPSAKKPETCQTEYRSHREPISYYGKKEDFTELGKSTWDIFLRYHQNSAGTNRSQKEFALGVADHPLSFFLFDYRKKNPGPPNLQHFLVAFHNLPSLKLTQANTMLQLLRRWGYSG